MSQIVTLMIVIMALRAAFRVLGLPWMALVRRVPSPALPAWVVFLLVLLFPLIPALIGLIWG